MSDLPICDFRLDTGCGVCYKCQIEKLEKENDKLSKQIKLLQLYEYAPKCLYDFYMDIKSNKTS